MSSFRDAVVPSPPVDKYREKKAKARKRKEKAKRSKDYKSSTKTVEETLGGGKVI